MELGWAYGALEARKHMGASTRHTGSVCGARAEAGNTDAAVGVADQCLCACAAAAGTAPQPSPSKVAAWGAVNRGAGVRAVRGTLNATPPVTPCAWTPLAPVHCLDTRSWPCPPADPSANSLRVSGKRSVNANGTAQHQRTAGAGWHGGSTQPAGAQQPLPLARFAHPLSQPLGGDYHQPLST